MFPGGAPRSHPVSSFSSSCLAQEGRGGAGGGDEEESVCLWRKEEPASSSAPSPRCRRMWTVFVFLRRSVVRAASPGMWSGERGRGREAERGGEMGGGRWHQRRSACSHQFPYSRSLTSHPFPPPLPFRQHSQVLTCPSHPADRTPPLHPPRGVSCSRFGVSHRLCRPSPPSLQVISALVTAARRC